MNTRPSWATIVLGAGILSAGCAGAHVGGPGGSGSGGGGGSGGGSMGGGACLAAPVRTVRRLSEREYLNVVTDLLGAPFAAVAAPLLPLEPTVAGFDNQNSALLVSAAFQESLASAAEKMSAMADAAMLAPCATPAGSPACLDAFARSFARKAFGRSPTNDEVQHLLTVAALGTSYANSVQLIIEVVLQSPQMLYLSQLGADAPAAGATVTLTQHEIASQLSFLLTGSRPDEPLLQAADQGKLAKPAERTAQVARLIATPRGRKQLRIFVGGWANMGPVSDAPKNAATFPGYTPAIAAAMQEEFDAFIDSNVAGGQGTLSALMSATSARIPPALAAIYGSELASGPGAAPTLDPKRRRGILSLPALLTFHAADQHSGPIERGLLVRRQLLCQQIPPPPPSVLQQVAANPIDSGDTARTTRMKYEQHKTQPFCTACHQHFDGIGFGMEEMDGIGRYRTTENRLPIDTSGQLEGTDVDGPFSGVVELSNKLGGSELFATCFVHQFFRFAEARDPGDSDQCAIDAWTKVFRGNGGHISDLFANYVSDPEFAVRKEDR